MNNRSLRKIFICNDVWWNIFPLLNRFELGLKLALLSDRFDSLVDKHFNAKTTELEIRRKIEIRRDERTLEAKLSVQMGFGHYMVFPLPKSPLPTSIRFRNLQICYIDHSVITFIRSNKQIFDKGTKLHLDIPNDGSIWDVMAREIWPVFAENIRHLAFLNGHRLSKLRRRVSLTMLTDLTLLNTIDSGHLFPDAIADDGPNAPAAQALSKWLHTPTTDGRPKRLFFRYYLARKRIAEWANKFKEAFRCATISASYNIQIESDHSISIAPFELVNERTNEQMTLMRTMDDNSVYTYQWLLKRCPIGQRGEGPQQQRKTAAENLDDLNSVFFFLPDVGPLSPPAAEIDQSNENSSNESAGVHRKINLFEN